jgi:UDP-glucose:(heptosyl)LPS alpha-1,3-glucosyltransferase
VKSCSAFPQLLIYRRGWSATGGAERYLLRFAAGLEKEGVCPILIADGKWPAGSWENRPIERLSGTGRGEELQRIRDRHPGALLFSMERLPGADVFRAGDGVHSAWLKRLAAEEGRLKHLFRSSRPMHRRLLAAEEALFRQRDLRVVANSRMAAEELILTHRLREEQIAVIPNGFDMPPLGDAERHTRRSELRRSLAIPVGATVFLFVGSGWKRKGAQTAVDAFRLLGRSDCHLILAGKGKAIRTSHPNIHLTGPVPDPTDLYLAADVFVLPTLYDPFSNACLEAAAFGLPVLTSDANGFAEVITDHPRSGQVIPIPRNTAAWAGAMERWTMPALREAAGPSLTAIRSHHTVSRNVTATIDFIRKTSLTPVP